MNLLETFFSWLDSGKIFIIKHKESRLVQPVYFIGEIAYPLILQVRHGLFLIAGKADYQSELSFWEGFFQGIDKFNRLYRDTMLDKKSRKRFFPTVMLRIIQRTGKKPKVLEIGTGPVSLLAYGVDQDLIEVVAIDPLASHYDKIMKKYSVKFPIKPLNLAGERILEKFKPGSFDIVYMSNSLDHVESPEKVLQNCHVLVKKGGFIVVEGSEKEGSNEHWGGLHQYDLYLSAGHLICCNRKGEISNLSDALRLSPVFSKNLKYSKRFPTLPIEKMWFTAAYRK